MNEIYFVFKNHFVDNDLIFICLIFFQKTIGNAVIAANVLKGKDPDPFSVCFGYGVGAMIAILGCGKFTKNDQRLPINNDNY